MLHIVACPRSAALRLCIAAFHYHEGSLPATIERILPNGQAHLMVNLAEDAFRTYNDVNGRLASRVGGAVLAGSHGRSVVIDTSEQRWLIAVEFKLGGAAAFFPMPASEACDQVIGLDDLWGRDGQLVRERLYSAPAVTSKFSVLEDMLLQHFIRPPDRAIAAAISLLDRGTPVAETHARLGLLPKTLVRRFRHEVGLTPKRFARVRRLQRVLASIQIPSRVDWCRVAAEYGFTDQAHFIRDFRELTGMTPTVYRPSSPNRRNHVPLDLLTQ